MEYFVREFLESVDFVYAKKCPAHTIFMVLLISLCLQNTSTIAICMTRHCFCSIFQGNTIFAVSKSHEADSLSEFAQEQCYLKNYRLPLLWGHLFVVDCGTKSKNLPKCLS